MPTRYLLPLSGSQWGRVQNWECLGRLNSIPRPVLEVSKAKAPEPSRKTDHQVGVGLSCSFYKKLLYSIYQPLQKTIIPKTGGVDRSLVGVGGGGAVGVAGRWGWRGGGALKVHKCFVHRSQCYLETLEAWVGRP